MYKHIKSVLEYYTSKTVACNSSENASRFAIIDCVSSTINAIKFPIPSPVKADVGTIDMY